MVSLLAIGVVPGGLFNFMSDTRKEIGWVVHDKEGLFFAGMHHGEDGSSTTWTQKVFGAYLFVDESAMLEFCGKVNEDGMVGQEIEREWRGIREPMLLVKRTLPEPVQN